MAAPPVKWNQWVLFPFWAVRILLMVVMIALYGIGLKSVMDSSSTNAPAIGVVVLFMLLIVGVLLIDLMAIAIYARGRLMPGSFLIMNSAQTGFWGGVVILDVVGMKKGQKGLGIVLTFVVFLLFLGLLIYAIMKSVRYRKQLQRGQYAPAHNPAAAHTTPVHTAPAHAFQPSYDNSVHYPNAPHYQNTAYYSPAGGAVELHGNIPTHGASADYYSGQPVKPANMF